MNLTHPQTKRLDLIPVTREEAIAMVEAMSPSQRAQLSVAWLAQLRASISTDPWIHGFSLVLRENGIGIGKCGFKGPPEADGVVEIAYGVQPDYQGKGYATEAAQALVGYAFADARVRVVRAHTLPEPNASTRVLIKCGFGFIGEVIDPEDGLIWRWERYPQGGA